MSRLTNLFWSRGKIVISLLVNKLESLLKSKRFQAPSLGQMSILVKGQNRGDCVNKIVLYYLCLYLLFYITNLLYDLSKLLIKGQMSILVDLEVVNSSCGNNT